jgi:CheY-like chemotaxis protein
LSDDPARPILVVDDTPINLTVIGRQLTRLGLSHEVTTDPLKGLELAKSGRYRALLVDVVMPNVDGPDFARDVRAWEKRTGAPRMPIVAVTGLAADDRPRCIAAGMDDFLMKPISFDALGDTLRRWLGGEGMPMPHDGRPLPTAASRDAIDVAKLGTILGVDDPEEISTIIEMFCDSFGPLAEALQEALSTHDRQATSRAAHTAKSAASTAAAVPLAELLAGIERAALSETWNDVAAQVAQVMPEFERIRLYSRERRA